MQSLSKIILSLDTSIVIVYQVFINE